MRKPSLTTPQSTTTTTLRPRDQRWPQPVRAVLDLFSSIWLGVILLTLLFIYSSIGSAGLIYPTSEGWVHVYPRQWRGLEMTEFEWFHWWPFDLLIALICINLVTATLRRIPLNAVRLGAWLIHAGIIMLALGSVWYFTAKLEGDTLVVRRQVMINLPGADPQPLPAVPGNRLVMRSERGDYTFQIADTDPEWELRSGDDEGKTTYSVSVLIQTPERRFVRQLLTGYPEYTEDVIPGQGRAVKVTGNAILDDTINLSLEPVAQRDFFLMQSSALYVRERGGFEWAQRPIPALPKYQDYLVDHDDVFLAIGDPEIPIDPLSIVAEATERHDPLPGVAFDVTGYLRYAFETSRMLEQGETLNPAVRLHFHTSDNQESDVELLAFDERQRDADDGSIIFRWVTNEDAVQSLARFVAPTITVAVPDKTEPITLQIDETVETNPDLSFRAIEGTDYAFRVLSYTNDLTIRPGTRVSLATVEIQTPEQTFRRWVFDDPINNRDFIPGESGDMAQETITTDPGIAITYEPGYQPPPLTVVGGPDENQLRLIVATTDPKQPRIHLVERGSEVALTEQVRVRIDRFLARAAIVTKPQIVPRHQRDKNLDLRLRMVQVRLPEGSKPEVLWLPFHDYVFRDQTEAMTRFEYRPKLAVLPDGREIELMFSRERRPLPAPVVLQDFDWQQHIGGYTGTNLSIRNWTSIVRFLDADTADDDTREVSVNDPAEYKGYWFFQAMWDPPMAQGPTGQPYKGLNYTVLGVGNREGVYVQLAGCIVAVFGMIYAFYIKPIIKRRRQQRVLDDVARREKSTATSPRTAREPEPALVASTEEVRS